MSHREEHISDIEGMEKTNEQVKIGNKHELTTTGSEEKRRKMQSSPSTPSKNIQQSPNNLTTPSSRRSGPLSSNEKSDQETLDGIILSEARGQTRMNVTHSEFSHRFLSRLKQGVIPRDTHIGLFEALNGRNASGEWGESTLYEDVLKNSMKTMCEACLLSPQDLLLHMLIDKTRIWTVLFNSVTTRTGPQAGRPWRPSPTFWF